MGMMMGLVRLEISDKTTLLGQLAEVVVFLLGKRIVHCEQQGIRSKTCFHPPTTLEILLRSLQSILLALKQPQHSPPQTQLNQHISLLRRLLTLPLIKFQQLSSE
jgi:hypothetical protein